MITILTLALGLFFVIGAAVVKYYKNSEFIEHVSIAVALGAMIGIGIFDIIPEVMEITPGTQYYLPIIGAIIGFILLTVFDKFIPEHEDEADDDYSDENMEHIGIISSVAIILHNVIEGMAVYSLAVTSFRQGFFLMLGIGLHNIPMGMFLYSTLRSQAKSKRISYIAMASLSTFLGGIIMMFINPYITEAFNCILYGIALGMILFIVIMELLPFVRKNQNRTISIAGAVSGLFIVLISTLF